MLTKKTEDSMEVKQLKSEVARLISENSALKLKIASLHEQMSKTARVAYDYLPYPEEER